MAARHTEGGASAPSNVLAFPERNKGRIRRSQSIEAAGEISLRMLARDGEAQPPNVKRLDWHGNDDDSLPERTPALLLALCIFYGLSAKRREDVREKLRSYAFDYDRSAAQLLRLFRPHR